METMQYPPHITFAVYDHISVPELFAAFDSTTMYLEKLTIRFESLGFFESPNAIILWAAPIAPEQVFAFHDRIHKEIDFNLCRKNYQPSVWVPHSSLAISIDPSRKDEALAIVEQSFDPVEVTFDVADCVSFMPVKVLRETPLTQYLE